MRWASSVRVVFGGFVAAIATTMVTAQGTHADFSGRWVMVSPQAGVEMIVKQDASTLTTEPPAGQNGPRTTLRLDGTESRNSTTSDQGEVVTLSRAVWKERELEVTGTAKWANGQTLDQVIRWSLDAQGRLILEVRNQGMEPVILTYRKQ